MLTSIIDPICKPKIYPPPPPPPHAVQGNGNVTFNNNNYNNSNCSISKNKSADSYTLTLWVYNTCNSTSSNCSVIISDTTLVQFKSTSVTVNTQSFTNTSGWVFVAVRCNLKINTVFVNLNPTTINAKLPSLTSVKIQPESINAGETFSIVDLRLYTGFLTDREIQQIYNVTILDPVLPNSECQCPESHPAILQDQNYYSLYCRDEMGTNTSRFQPDSAVEFVVDGNQTTAWKNNVSDLSLTVQLQQPYQIDTIEVIMTSTPSNVNIALDSGLEKIITNSSTIKWMDISGGIQNRSQFLKSVTRSIMLQFRFSGNTNGITEIIISGRCNCHGNAVNCTYTDSSGHYTCACTKNTQNDDCGNCASGYFRQTEDFGCINMCQCDNNGSVNSAATCHEVGGQCSCKANVEGRTCDTCKHVHFNLSSINVDGCSRSNCYANGTISCNENITCSSCICKPNVTNSNCSECYKFYYGIDAIADGCLPCDCNTSGIDTDKQCNMTGQCKCKTNVEGNKCDHCKNGYFGFSSLKSSGCDKCNCNTYASNSQQCDNITGQCDCRGEKKNKQCEPKIENMVPNYGPMAGGTVVTVTGYLLGSGNVTTTDLIVFANNDTTAPYRLITWEQNKLVFETKSSGGVKISQIGFRWSKAYSDSIDIILYSQFSFKANPSITEVLPMTSFKSGGCDIRFRGTSLDSVYSPQLKSYFSDNEYNLTWCTATATELVCRSPDLSGTNITKISFGLVFDGMTMYDNLTDSFKDRASASVTDNPMVYGNSYADYKMLFSDAITIQGSRLTSACQGNLKVIIGNVNCLIETTNDNQIVCKPDLTFPGITQETTDIMVVIGNFKRSAGAIKLISFWDTQEFIGIAAGVAAFVILVFVIVICCCCRHRRGQNYSKTPAQNGIEVPLSVSSSISHLIQKEEVPRFSNKYSVMPVETALTYDDTDCGEDFLHKLEHSVREKIQKSISNRSYIEPDNVCTFKGNDIRIIHGKFSNESPNSGKELSIKTNIKTLKELLVDNKYPVWINNGLVECMKFQDCFHDNILRILGISVDKNRFYILYPSTERGLKEYLNDAKRDFTVKELLEMCVQVAEGMTYLSNENMVHKDLAARNCVITKDGTVQISDASFSWNLYPKEYMYDEQRQRYLPVRWMALESLKMGFYDISSDVWSFGVLVWEIMTLALYLPYYDKESDASIKSHIDDGFRLGMPTNAPEELYGLMVNCWEAENHLRPTFDDIIFKLRDIMRPDSMYVNLDALTGKKNKPAPPIPTATLNHGYQP